MKDEQVKNIEQDANKEYELTITADKIESTEVPFEPTDPNFADNYRAKDVYFAKGNGEIKRRFPNVKGENQISNRTMPRLAFQEFEEGIKALSETERAEFPTCPFRINSNFSSRGIFTDYPDYKEKAHTDWRLEYTYDDGSKFIIFSGNTFSTITFVQECLKRFGEPGDKFVLTYREKEINEEDNPSDDEENMSEDAKVTEIDSEVYINDYSRTLIESKNIIFRGAPGTGKTYLARKIAADIVSGGETDDYKSLTIEQKEQVEFVQFHPSYDYTDFVEGLRPIKNADGSMSFELQDGIFKKFVERARENYKVAGRSQEEAGIEVSQNAIDEFFHDFDYDEKFETKNHSEFYITDVDEKRIKIYIPKNPSVNKLTLQKSRICKMLESGREFKSLGELTDFFGIKNTQAEFSYYLVLYNEIRKNKKVIPKKNQQQIKTKKYVFIIDEINRGEISKIFGELFFAMDPEYRGKAGEVSTQYSYLPNENEAEKFYIPENMYIIGTMNDIDRSVDSFDFAMRRRFRFIEIKPEDRIEMLDELDDELRANAKAKMKALNKAIVDVDDLNANYQIGPAYFKKLKDMEGLNSNGRFEKLWTDYLQPLLHEYIQGMYNEAEIMKDFEKAYNLEGKSDESTQN